MRFFSALVLCLCVACGNSQSPAKPDPHAHHHHDGSAATPPTTANPTGAILEISCGAESQKQFDRGFFFLHNMDYVAARKVYEEAAGANPKCAMLQWGVAMTYFQPLWPGQPTAKALETGRAAIDRAKALDATPREKDFIAALAPMYEGEKVDTPTRYKNWDAGQRALAAKYPDDVEAQAFWCLSRLATVDRKDKTYKEALAVAELLQKLLVARPDHPGLLHYLLHAYDNPAYAQQAVEAAKKYEQVSPDAAHALHMPSHIHVRLGNWQEVIDWNIKSAAAALKHPVEGRVSRDFLHATDYLIYGYLQTGDDEKAREALGKISPATKYELNSGPGAYGLAASPARFALERRQWKDAAALVLKQVDYSWDLYPWAEAVTHAARGLGAARTKDFKTAEAELAQLDRLKPTIESPWWQNRVQIDRDVVRAWIGFHRGDKAAEALMASAAKRELEGGKDNVEPGHVITAVEELGDFQLERKNYKAALDAYKSALKESPKRFNALYGAGRAAELAGLVDEAKSYYTQLVAISGTSKRPERASAQTFLAGH